MHCWMFSSTHKLFSLDVSSTLLSILSPDRAKLRTTDLIRPFLIIDLMVFTRFRDYDV